MQKFRWNGRSFETQSRGSAANSVVRRAAWFGLFIGVAFAIVSAPALAAGEFEGGAELRTEKESWQSEYRDLISKAARLRDVIARERELYADANRRNYRRGQKRHVHLEAIDVATKELGEVEARLATFADDARRAGAPPGWLNEVEIDLEDETRLPAIAAGPGDEGRNPIYREPTDEGALFTEPTNRDDDGGRNPLYLEQDGEDD
jgi:hypothetical protein